MNTPSPKKETMTRKQFLVLLSSLVGGALLPQFFVTSKMEYTRYNTYGNNTYGSKKG